MIPRIETGLAEPLDPFDPRLLAIERPDDELFLSLSSDHCLCCKIDRQDHEWARAYLWCHTYGSGSIETETGIIERPDHIYARRCVATDELTRNGKPRKLTLWLHRLILTIAEGPPPWGCIGDHINGDTLDNRRINLRWADKSANARNIRGSAERARLVAEQEAVQLIARAVASGALPRLAA